MNVASLNSAHSLRNKLKQSLTVAGMLLLASCGGGGSNGNGTALSPAPAQVTPSVTLSLSSSGVVAGQAATLTWTASDSSSCSASDAWTGSRPVSGSTTVVQAVPGTYSYTLTCGGSGGTTMASTTLTVAAGPGNVAMMMVDSGPNSASFNVPFVDVTICRPGTTQCQTIDHIMVDTASNGLRLMASELNSTLSDPALGLPASVNGSGNAVGECAHFASGFTWGSVRTADVRIAGESAMGLPIQVMGDAPGGYGGIPSACASIGANIGSVAALGAKGVLGVGMFSQDCGSACVASTAPRMYYGCTAGGCTTTTMPLANQVTNPVSAFAVNNNGVLLVLPSVPAGGASSVSGALVFGIGTQTNNGLGGASVYAANGQGNFTTIYKGTSLTSSFLDSGSNGLFFSDPTIQKCSSGFYCPSSTLALTAVNSAFDGSASGSVGFTIENINTLASNASAANVGGGISGISGFDWGLPFFFGRSVFVAMQGASTPKGTGPYWAY